MRLRLVTGILLSVVLFPFVGRTMHASEGPEYLLFENQPFSVSLRGSVGLLNGRAWETVYDNDPDYPDTKGYKISELYWDLRNLWMGGGVLSVTAFDRFHLNAGYWLPLNKGSGQMDDYDWLTYEWGSEWTDWSLSDVDVTKAHMMDLNVSIDVFKREAVNIRVLGGYKEDNWEWKDYGIYHVYSTDPYTDWGFRDDIGQDDYSTGIEYEQTYKLPYLGVGLDYVHNNLSLNAYFAYSAWVKADDRDYHVFRNVLFTEEFSGGKYYGVGIKGTYTFAKYFFVSVGVDYQDIPEIIGDTTIVGDEGNDFFSDSAGIRHQSTMFSLSLGAAY